MTTFFKRLVFKQEETHPEAKKEAIFNLYNGLNENQAIVKTEKLTQFFIKFGNKIHEKHIQNRTYAFVRLHLVHRKAVLSKIAFKKLKTLLLKKNLDGFYHFFNKASKPGTFRWKTLKQFEEKSGITLKEWDFDRKDIGTAEVNKIRKIVSDFGISGDSPYEQNIVFKVVRVFISDKYAIKILRMLMETNRKKRLYYGFAKIMLEKTKNKPPKVLQEYLSKKLKEKKDVEKFLSSPLQAKVGKNREKMLILHNQELNKIHSKLENPKDLKLRVRENLILSNWAGQILNRIMRFYKREYYNLGFSKIYRAFQQEKYRRKLLMSLYERYRSHRLRDLTVSYIKWKLNSFDSEKYIKIRALIDAIGSVVRRTKKARFWEFMMRLGGEEKGGFMGRTEKLWASLMMIRVFNRKTMVIVEYAFRRIRHEDLLEELSRKIQGIDLLERMIREKKLKSAWGRIDGLKKKNAGSLIKRVEMVFRIRKVVVFFKMLAIARLNENNIKNTRN